MYRMPKRVGEQLISARALSEYQSRFPGVTSAQINDLAVTSAWLRKEREFSFYGDIDFIPTERYTCHDADRAIDDATRVVVTAATVIVRPE